MARENRDDGPLGPPVFRCPQEIKSRNDEVSRGQGEGVLGRREWWLGQVLLMVPC